MKFLTNIHRNENYVLCSPGESRDQAIEKHRRFLEGKLIDSPKETARFTVEELEEMGMVGVYEAD